MWSRVRDDGEHEGLGFRGLGFFPPPAQPDQVPVEDPLDGARVKTRVKSYCSWCPGKWKSRNLARHQALLVPQYPTCTFFGFLSERISLAYWGRKPAYKAKRGNLEVHGWL